MLPATTYGATAPVVKHEVVVSDVPMNERQEDHGGAPSECKSPPHSTSTSPPDLVGDDTDLTYKTVWSYHVHSGRRVTCSTVSHATAARPTCWKRTLWIRLPPFLSAKLWTRYNYSLADVFETLDCYQSYDLWHLALELGGTLSNQAVKQSFATTDYVSIGSMHNTCGGRATVLERDRAEIGKAYANKDGPSVLRHNRVRAANASHQSARQQGAVLSPWALAGARDVHKTMARSSLSVTTVPPMKLKFIPPDLPFVTVDHDTFRSYEHEIRSAQQEFDLTVPDAWTKISSTLAQQIARAAPPDVRLLVQMVRTLPPVQFKDIAVVPICRDGLTGYILMRRVVRESVFRRHYGQPYCMFFQTLRAVICDELYAFHLEQFWVYCPAAEARMADAKPLPLPAPVSVSAAISAPASATLHKRVRQEEEQEQDVIATDARAPDVDKAGGGGGGGGGGAKRRRTTATTARASRRRPKPDPVIVVKHEPSPSSLLLNAVQQVNAVQQGTRRLSLRSSAVTLSPPTVPTHPPLPHSAADMPVPSLSSEHHRIRLSRSRVIKQEPAETLCVSIPPQQQQQEKQQEQQQVQQQEQKKQQEQQPQPTEQPVHVFLNRDGMSDGMASSFLAHSEHTQADAAPRTTAQPAAKRKKRPKTTPSAGPTGRAPRKQVTSNSTTAHPTVLSGTTAAARRNNKKAAAAAAAAAAAQQQQPVDFSSVPLWTRSFLSSPGWSSVDAPL